MTYDLKQFDVFCPLCNEHITGYSRALGLHAKSHGLSSEDFHVKVLYDGKHPTCQCKLGCEAKTKWLGWNKGFAKFVIGHFSDELISRRKETQSANYKAGKIIHWTKKDENKEVLKLSAKKTQESLKEAYESGKLVHWSTTPDAKLISEKITNTRRKKYDPKKHWKRLSSEEFIQRINVILGDRFDVLDGLTNFPDRTNNLEHFLKIRCRLCNFEHQYTIYNVVRRGETELRCLSCGYNSAPSKGQIEIANFIKTLGVAVQENNRTAIYPLELDVFVPQQKFAVEFNGLYWHSELFSEPNQLENKRNLCEQSLISCLFLFEDEWNEKTEVCKSMIMHRLHKNTVKIGARKCTVTELSIKERQEFFDSNHLEGDVPSTIALGLKTPDGTIVAAVSLRRPLTKTKDVIEIGRFATKVYTSVPGALAKLLKSVKSWSIQSGYKKILTYVDSRVGNGNSYEQVGFIRESITTPRFWWTDKNKRFSRQTFRAQNGLTEKEVSLSAKVYKIFGCSNFRFIFTL